MKKLIEDFPGHQFILDGVYQLMRNDLAPLADAYDNAHFVGSFSKLFGLVGLRTGYIIGKNASTLSLHLVLSPLNIEICRSDG